MEPKIQQQQQQQQDYQDTVILDSVQVSDEQLAGEVKEHQFNEDEYLEMVRQLKLNLADKSNECELLKIELSESKQAVDSLSQELNECRLAIFENNEDSRKTHEEIMRSKKLEEDCVKLMSDLLELKEQSDHHKQTIMDNYISKANAINTFECFQSSGAIEAELQQYKADFDEKLIELQLALAKVRNLEDENQLKDKKIVEMKKALEDAKISRVHEIKVLDEYINCLKNTISSYEKTLANYDTKSQLTDDEDEIRKDLSLDNS